MSDTITDREMASLERIAALRAEVFRWQRESGMLRDWLGAHLRYEAGVKRRLYLRPDGGVDGRHYGTPGEAIDAALKAAYAALRCGIAR